MRQVRAPFTGEVIGAFDDDDRRTVVEAFDRARAAHAAWAATSVDARASIILRFHDIVAQRRNEVLDLLQREAGKARRDALEEVLDVLIAARHYARDARRLLADRRVRGAIPLVVGAEVRHIPWGVVAVIAPWNYPLTLTASDAIPALLAGNCVVVKPDEHTSLTALWVLERFREAGLPRDVLQTVLGPGDVVGPWVIDEADYVMFTGSTRVGRIVATACGERLIPCSMELGGKNAMIIRADADPERAAEIAVRASFANAGQLCISMERIYVNRTIEATFTAAFVRRTLALRLGTQIGWGSDVGSLISGRQLARVQSHVDDAVSKGATSLAGGRPRPDIGPYFFEPTILAGVTEAMVACDEETFGPVVAIHPVGSDEEAVRRANATEYGLNASVVGRDRRAARRVARELRAGTVNVNEGYAAAWGSVRAPMGGMGQSGLGRRHGDEGLLKYTQSQSIVTQRALGFGSPEGLTDERWGSALVFAVTAMKRLGLK